MSTKIEWTDETWNPVIGCEHVSPGCDHCYAAREASGRLSVHPLYAGLAAGGKFTGEVRLLPERLGTPLRWTKPRRVFVNSMSDLFHKDVPDEYIADVFAVMGATPRHTYQILTKRHGRLRALLNSPAFPDLYDLALRRLMMSGDLTEAGCAAAPPLPLPNVWLGVSVEDQQRADLRVPALLSTPAAVRFLSCEPLLGPVALCGPWHDWLLGWETASEHHPSCDGSCSDCPVPVQVATAHLDWIIVGGESGPGARPMHPAWAQTIRDDCIVAGVAFHFKQWGEWTPDDNFALPLDRCVQLLPDGTRYTTDRLNDWPTAVQLHRVGKRHAGRTLDGRTWDEYPDTRTETPTPC